MSRYLNKKAKKKSKLFKFLTVLLVLFVMVTGYGVYQYYQGLKSAGDSQIDQADIDFNGAKIEEKVNVLLLGVDSRGEEKSRTDTIMIAQYDPKNNTSKLVSVMRDIYVEIPGYKNNKINTAYFHGGAELLRQTIKQNFDIDIHYYALVDFQGFEKVVDALAPNGVEIDVEKKMSYRIGVVLEPGLQKLNGKELLGYARFRHDAQGDFARVERQQKVISALKDEMISFYGVTRLPKMIGTVQPFIVTNLNGLDRMSLITDFLLNPPDDIETLRIPIEGSYWDESYRHAGSVLELDMEKNKQALQQFLNPDTQ
jgi:polyisoprenyl-teichoic acid--peptidoglycan teichoic acid transferase